MINQYLLKSINNFIIILLSSILYRCIGATLRLALSAKAHRVVTVVCARQGIAQLKECYARRTRRSAPTIKFVLRKISFTTPSYNSSDFTMGMMRFSNSNSAFLDGQLFNSSERHVAFDHYYSCLPIEDLIRWIVSLRSPF